MQGSSSDQTRTLEIRTYETYYAHSESDSASESCSEFEVEVDENQSTRTRFEANLQYLNSMMETWNLKELEDTTSDGKRVSLVVHPSASKINNDVLNPYLYRGLREISSLDHLADLLGVGQEWHAEFQDVARNREIIAMFNYFRTLDENVLENVIESTFESIVMALASKIELKYPLKHGQTSVIVGGFLAKHELDVKSKTDVHFSFNGRNMIASEVKTSKMFPTSIPWYYGSRGAQVLTAMYAHNSPTFLLSQRYWKVFVESEDRRSIYTFPYGKETSESAHVNNKKVEPMNEGFLCALVICLLAGKKFKKEKTREAVAVTPERVNVKPKYKDSGKKGVRRSKRLMTGRVSQPEFISGYENGKPIYSEIRIMNKEDVEKIDFELTEGASEVTLV